MRGLSAFYIIPALGFVLGLWALHGLLREAGLGATGRRVALIPSATIALAPTIVPAGTIMTALVPYGLLALGGFAPMLHQPVLVRFALSSFAITGGIMVAACLLLVRRSGDRSAGAPPNARRVGTYLGILAALSGAYVLFFVERTLPDHVDAGLIESEYGHYLDAAARTLDMEDLSAVEAERLRLREFFEVDPVLIGVSMYDKRLPSDGRRYADIYAKPLDAKGFSCTSKPTPFGNNRLVFRCTRGRGMHGLETIKYRRRFQRGDSWHSVEIEFEQDAFLARHPATE